MKENTADNIAAKGAGLSKNSQAARLRGIVRVTKASLIAGVALLVLFLVSAVVFAAASNQQIECVTYLNQYRLGSKNLTYAVQSYAVTGDEQYYEAYMRELEVDKNRDIALNKLENSSLTDDEWSTLNEIAELSDGLVPLEEDALALVSEGDLETAVDFVFGEEYKDTVQSISSLTDTLIEGTQARLNRRKNIALGMQTVSALLFLAGFIQMALQCLRTIKFANDEMLLPIVKASERLALASEGLSEACTTQACQVSDMVNLISQLQENIIYNEKEAQEAVKISMLAGSTLVAAGESMDKLKAAGETGIAEDLEVCMEEARMAFDELSSRIGGIAERYGADAESISQISDGIGVLAGVVDMNSATAAETAAVGGELKQQADALAAMMDKFKI